MSILCRNQETGEIIENWKLRWMGPVYDENRFYLSANVNGREIQEKNIGCYQKKKEKTEPIIHPLFGESILIQHETRFTKVMIMPEFSKTQYYEFWMRIERSLERNTGAICLRYKNGNLKRISSIEEWMTFLNVGKNPIYCFLKEAIYQTYIAKFITGKTMCWIANPHYVWNGMLIPLSIYKLFNNKIK